MLFQAGQCSALSSFRVRKWCFSRKRVGFHNSGKNASGKRVHSEKGVNFYTSNTLFRVRFAILSSSIGT